MSEVRVSESRVRVTATEVLRRLLDERGVEWEGETDEDGWAFTRWHGFDDTGWRAASDELCGMLDLQGRFLFTPTQAIEATLGRGECHVLSTACNDYGHAPQMSDYTFELSCGHSVTWDEQPDYCPHCGRKVVS